MRGELCASRTIGSASCYGYLDAVPSEHEYIIMTGNTLGSCLCGTVKFQISGELESFLLCHCKRCRKDTGSAHAANLFSSTAKLTWFSGHESVQTYQVPDTRHKKSFCSKCGSALPVVQSDGDSIVVPAGSIDSAIDIRPSQHICFESRADWDMRLEDVPKIDDIPI
ncbi:GFA family protein [Saliniramus fredricksonii]